MMECQEKDDRSVLQLPPRRGAFIDWAVEIPPFSFCIKGL